MPTTYTIDQTVTPASSNSSANITISQTASKTASISSPYNKNRKEKKITANIPVIFSTKTNTDPVIMYTRVNTNPIVFYLRYSLVTFYSFLKISISKTIDAIVESLITSYTIGKNIAQTITMAFGAIVPTSAAITISETIDMTDTSLDTDNDQDATDNGAIEPEVTNSSANITISQTSDKTTIIGTEYSTVVA